MCIRDRNIDEVYLDLDRRAAGDTSQHDVSFVYEAPSLLANYQNIPWEQFTQNDLADTIFMFERSNDNNPNGINLAYRDSILSIPMAYPSATRFLAGNNNIYPFGSINPNTNTLSLIHI